MFSIFRFVLSIAHFVYSLYCFLLKQCKLFLSTIERCGFLNKVPYKSFTSSNTIFEISKLPKHLAVVLGHEEISIYDIVELISWCISADIPYVSFYDYKGILLKNKNNLKEKLNELEPLILKNLEWTNISNSSGDSYKINTEPIKLKNNYYSSRIINSNEMNLVKKSKTSLQILSYCDGKDKIINLTKTLADATNLNILQIENITTDLIDEKITLNGSLPDPDLAIIYGDTMCTYGFLPWQTRVTQFFILPSHHNISASSFYETLVRYSKCQQRYGK